MNEKRYTEKGFTLIELLVVVAIIGLLSSVVLTNLNEARQRARDAKRLSDMRQITTALELFYSTHKRYPNWTIDRVANTGEFIGIGDDIDRALSPFLPNIPKDPKHDGLVYFYSYDPTHYIALSNCSGSSPQGSSLAFNKAETDAFTLRKDTVCGTNMNHDRADFNIGFLNL